MKPNTANNLKKKPKQILTNCRNIEILTLESELFLKNLYFYS